MADVEKLKEAALAAVDRRRDEIVGLSRRIHARPEIALGEHYAAESCCELLGLAGYEVRLGIGELATAFVATLGGEEPGPAIGLVGEYDALPGLGHACGHNLIAAAVVGAGLALADVSFTRSEVERVKDVGGQLPGTVKVFGAPAEETGVGKPAMLKAGAFEGTEVALGYHTGSRAMARGATNGLLLMEYTFRGRASHGGQDPWAGVSALDAVLLLFAGVNALRQFARDGTRFHGVITNGGEAFNVTPESATAQLAVRAPDVGYIREVTARVIACAEGAARATGTRLETREMAFFDVVKFNRSLDAVVANNMQRLGLDYAEPGAVTASSDFGNVSQVLPGIYFGTRTWGAGIAFHTREATAAAVTPMAEAAMLDGARCLALSAIDLLTEPEHVRRAKAEFRASS
ncbi:MAG: M20 family metallopeptidase [Chloroflexi bacterium]|nr:M20 family metallopeptidase [Chloroflexota bacterium]